MGTEISKIQNGERIACSHCGCMEGEGRLYLRGCLRLYLRGLLASLRLPVRMVGGCYGNTTDRFGTSLRGKMVVHNVLVQEGGQGSE